MAMGRPLTPLALSASARAQLESMAHSRSLPHGLVRRAEIVLLAAEGWPHEAVAGAVGVTRATVGKGRQRFLENGLNGLYDERRSGAPRLITDEQVAEVIYRTLKTKPKDQTQWSVRSMGAETGLTKDAVHRIGRTYGLQPHRHKHFKLSTDPFLVDKVRTRARPGAVRGREESDPGVGTKSAPATPWAWATWKGLRTPTSATAPPLPPWTWPPVK
jgi:transposase